VEANENGIIRLEGITKTFPGVVANSDINITIQSGEVHAIVGENGAGKSTLMKILAGLYQPDSGHIYVRGKKQIISSPRAAINLGIGMVHQHFMLIPRFTVLENIILGAEASKSGMINFSEARKNVKELCARYNFRLDLDVPLEELSVGQRQRVEIIKVLYRGADILVLDEPTAVLAPQEVNDLFENLKKLKEQGKTVIFISHKLDEVLNIADRITVLRKGKVVGTIGRTGVTKSRLAEMMVGRPVLFKLKRPDAVPGDILLETKDLTVVSGDNREILKNISIKIRGGEIYGIAGIEGNGQKELAEAFIGLQSIASGSVYIAGKRINGLDAGAIRKIGVAYISEDRHQQGLVLPMKVWENCILGSHRDKRFSSGFRLLINNILSFTREKVKEFNISLGSIFSPVKNLSGGNQQKVILARELSYEPMVIIAAQPNRGLDIGSAEFVNNLLLKARGEGRAVLLISADLEEILTLADRIGIIYNGRIVKEFIPDEVTPEEIGYYMLGGKGKAEVV
jgi:simple sugar transport system ATP-binding protein